jgi:hypothetical protein
MLQKSTQKLLPSDFLMNGLTALPIHPFISHCLMVTSDDTFITDGCALHISGQIAEGLLSTAYVLDIDVPGLLPGPIGHGLPQIGVELGELIPYPIPHPRGQHGGGKKEVSLF